MPTRRILAALAIGLLLTFAAVAAGDWHHHHYCWWCHREPPKPPPPPKEEPPKEEPPIEGPPHEEGPKETGSFLAGLNAGYWGSSEYADLTTAARVVRLDTPYSTTPWEQAGLKVIADMAGPYSSSGVSGVNVQAYVERDLALVKANPHLYALETLNEPGGNWFWGSGSESSTNRAAYASLVIRVHDALVSTFGANRPLQLCSYDGGHDSSNAWGEAWTANKTALADCDLITEHPYGGTGERARASLGNRGQVERAHAQTGKPVAITEVGFPTVGPTGDSLQYTEAEQATSVGSIVRWARSTGYVPVITIYGYRDSSEAGGYGLERHNGSHKPAWKALAEAGG